MRVVLLIALLNYSHAVTSQGLGDLIEEIEGQMGVSDPRRSQVDSVWVSIEGWSTEGGEATGYFHRGGDLAIARLWLFGETGKLFSSFYYENGQIALIEWKDFRYNRPFYWNEKEYEGDEVFDPLKTRTIERRFFFENGRRVYVEEHVDTGAIGYYPLQDSILLGDAMGLRQQLNEAHGRREPWPVEAMNWRQPELLKGSTCSFVEPDTAVAGIALGNALSAIAVAGETPFEVLIEGDGMPHANFRSSDGSQVLTLYFHYGDAENEFSEFRVTRSLQDSIRAVIPVHEFRSGRGIALGIREEKARAILGKCCVVGTASNGHRLLRYRITDHASSNVLQGYGMPSYYATLEFADDRLIEYRFGFEYP